MSTTFKLNKTKITAIDIISTKSTQPISLNYVQDVDKHILWYSGKEVSIGSSTYSYQFTGEQLSYSGVISVITDAGADVSKATFSPTLTDPTTVGDYVYGPITPLLGNVWSDTISITEKYITFSVDPSYLNAIFSISKSASALGICPELSLAVNCDQIDLYDIQTGGSELNSVTDGDANFNKVLSYIQSGFKYQWERNNGEDYEDIAGATSASYVIQNSDLNYAIRCKISFKGTTNVDGSVDNKYFYTSWTDTVYTNKLDSSIFTKGTVKTYNNVEYSVIPISATYDSSTSYYKRGSCYFAITGTTKGTAAQSYSYTVTPVGGTVWSDTGTSTAKTFTWSISKANIKKDDYYDSTSYRGWTGSDQSLTLSSTSYVTVSGTTSATAIGAYTAILTPDSNHQWSDGTSDAYEVEWNISAFIITKDMVEANASKSGTTVYGNGDVSDKVPGDKTGLTYKGYFFKQKKTNDSWPTDNDTGTWGSNEMSGKLGSNSQCGWSLTENTRIAFRVTAIVSSNTNYTGWTGSQSDYKGGSGWQKI